MLIDVEAKRASGTADAVAKHNGGSMGRSMNSFVVAGVIFVLLGLLGFAMPMFTTQKTEEVAKIGDLKLQTTESTSHRIPTILSGGAVVLGVVLIGAGLYRKR
jgi:uncharacterized membrane protein HdeD (DUF308 family)